MNLPEETDRSAEEASALAAFAADVRQSLSRTPRQLPSRYLYDPLGSALFDAICHLPWYRVTRAESRLLDAHGAALLRQLQPLSALIELGPGNGDKVKRLLQAGERPASRLALHLVDVSKRALAVARQSLDELDDVHVVTHSAEYLAGLREAAFGRRATDGRMAVLFLGSNIGNFDPPCATELLHGIRDSLRPGDALVLGTDLLKPERELLLAYDDPLGVTAAFNRNLLARINGELQGNFDIAAFAHEAVWNAGASRMEMWLVARSAQPVRIAGVPMEFTLQAGERIWTESSYKYRPAGVAAMLAGARFEPSVQWIDDQDGFMLTLAEATR